MNKLDILSQVKKEAIIAVIRAENKEEAKMLVEAVYKGGINILEITMTVPDGVEIIKELRKEYDSDCSILIGAGTVLDSETARICILNGAKFVVSPSYSESVIRTCNRYQVPVFSGSMTITEAIGGMEIGADIIKIFPGGAFGPSIIKDYLGPIPYGNFMPTGGVSLENVGEWIHNGAIAVGTGSSLTSAAKSGNYLKVTETAKLFVEAVQKALQSK